MNTDYLLLTAITVWHLIVASIAAAATARGIWYGTLSIEGAMLYTIGFLLSVAMVIVWFVYFHGVSREVSR